MSRHIKTIGGTAVIHSPLLAESRFQVSVRSLRLLVVAIARLEPSSATDHKVHISDDDLINLVKLDSSRIWTEINEMRDHLIKPIEVPQTNRNRKKLAALCSTIEYSKGTGCTLTFGADILPLLMTLKPVFVSYELEELCRLRLTAAQRLFMICARDDMKGVMSYPAESLYELIHNEVPGAEERFWRFKSNTLDRAVLEINRETSLDLTMENEQVGNRKASAPGTWPVVHLSFSRRTPLTINEERLQALTQLSFDLGVAGDEAVKGNSTQREKQSATVSSNSDGLPPLFLERLKSVGIERSSFGRIYAALHQHGYDDTNMVARIDSVIADAQLRYVGQPINRVVAKGLLQNWKTGTASKESAKADTPKQTSDLNADEASSWASLIKWYDANAKLAHEKTFVAWFTKLSVKAQSQIINAVIAEYSLDSEDFDDELNWLEHPRLRGIAQSHCERNGLSNSYTRPVKSVIVDAAKKAGGWTAALADQLSV